MTLLYVAGFLVFGAVAGRGATLVYAVWMVALLVAVALLDRRAHFSTGVLTGLSLWGFLHMAGGLLPVGDGVLYGVWLLPFLRFDQLVHAFGFGVAGLAGREALGAWLPGGAPTGGAGAAVVIMAGLALGAVNEVLEFIATLLIPETNVGGYENTGWDLVANTVGSVAAGVAVGVRTGRSSTAPASTP
jgi:putative membrane protein